MSRAEQLDKKYDKVRIWFEIPCMTAGATGAQVRDVWWIEDKTDDYWMAVDDGTTQPYRIPRKCIANIQPLD